jgi:hypothetical protein
MQAHGQVVVRGAVDQFGVLCFGLLITKLSILYVVVLCITVKPYNLIVLYSYFG